MKKKDLAERIAKEVHLPTATAADELDDAIHRVLRSLRNPNRPRATALERLVNEAVEGGHHKCPAKS